MLKASHSSGGTQKGDVYAFGIILHEIISLLGPWGETRMSDRGWYIRRLIVIEICEIDILSIYVYIID